MQTHHFPCPFCGRKMGVGADLLGRKVRCPHCKQVVLAPSPPADPPTAAALTPAAPQPPPVAPKPAAAPPVPDDLPVFNLPKREAAESIFGEATEESDDLFGSDATRLAVPELPPPDPTPTAVVPVSIVTPDPLPQPEAAPGTDPFVNLGAPEPAPPRPVAPPPQPVPAPIPEPPAPAPADGANPWASFDTMTAAPPSAPTAPVQPVAVPVPDAEPEARRSQPRSVHRARSAPPAGGGGTAFKVGFFVALAYAVVVTGLAVYGLFFKSGAPTGHPLSTIPDDFGEFKPAERKKTGKLAVPVDGELPPELRVALGEKLTIGSLEVTPTKVEARRLDRIGEYTSGRKETLPSTPPALVLTMTIRNTSDDLLIHPTDPAFNRKVTVPTERVGTGLVVGSQTFWGGAIDWPFRKQVSRMYEAAQEADATPLNPGEAREYVVFTDAKSEILRAVRNATDGLLWRVQVRRGRVEFDGKDIPVTAIIGVDFKPGDVRGLD